MSRFFRRGSDSDSDSSSSDEEELMSSDDERPSKPAAPEAAKPMSRFLRTAGSDSSSSDSSDDDEESMSDDDGEKGAAKKSRFLKSDSEDDGSDEDTKRVVKSAKDKRLDEMEACGKLMDNALKINDWVAISNGTLTLPSSLYFSSHSLLEFDKLVRMVQRQQNVAEPVPSFYIRTLSSLETSLNEALTKEKEAKKKMNASNARALTAMRQKIKKTAKEYEGDIKQYQEVRFDMLFWLNR